MDDRGLKLYQIQDLEAELARVREELKRHKAAMLDWQEKAVRHEQQVRELQGERAARKKAEAEIERLWSVIKGEPNDLSPKCNSDECETPACALVAGRWYCLKHLRDLAQTSLEKLSR